MHYTCMHVHSTNECITCMCICPTNAEKTKQVEQLELMVARLESTLGYFVAYGQSPAPCVQLQAPPPLPPKGLPVSSGALPPLPPKRPPPSFLAALPYHTLHGRLDTLQFLSIRQSPGAGPSATLAFSPQPPQHLPSPLEETPSPPRHCPLHLPPSPGESLSAPHHSILPRPLKRRTPLCSAGKLPSSSIHKNTLLSGLCCPD